MFFIFFFFMSHWKYFHVVFSFCSIPLVEIIEMLENGQSLEQVEITMIPPEEGGHITEEDSGDEIDFDMNHLPPSILRTEIDALVVSNEIVSSDTDDEHQIGDVSHAPVQSSIVRQPTLPHTSDRQSDKPTERRRKRKSAVLSNTNVPSVNPVRESKTKTVKPKKPNYNWKDDEKNFSEKVGKGDVEEVSTEYMGDELSCVQCFEKMFSEQIISHMTNMSNLYALQRNSTLNVTNEEMKTYIAILLLTGYMEPKYMRMFWETQSDTHNALVSKSMRRDRFLEIQKFLHVSDNYDLPHNDKFAKVRVYFDMLCKNFTENFKLMGSTHLSVDESMVPYYGKHGSKQHLKGKPIRFGFKIWSVASKNGYLAFFEPYQGAKAAPLPRQEEVGLGAAVVLHLVSSLPEELGPFNIYADNFFTGFSLLDIMSKNNIGYTGTVRENRCNDCPLMPSKELKKMPRGSFSSQTSKSLCAVRWNDNSIVTAVSNCHGVSPVKKVDRIAFVEKKRAKISLECPRIIVLYNTYMGGVDRLDENVQSLRVSLKGKKWWFQLFLFGLDAACQNAWLLRKRVSTDQLTYCDFRRRIVQEYLYKHGAAPQRIQHVSNVPHTKRNTKKFEYKNTHEQEKCSQRRCKECQQRTRIMCKTCKVPLHVHCWYIFHKKH